MKVIAIGSRIFSSKKEAKEYYRNILYSCKINTPLYGTYYNDMIELFGYHPDYVEKTSSFPDTWIPTITVGITEWNNRCFYISDNGMNPIDFSFIACIDGAKSNYHNFTSSCRRAIDDDIVTFKTAFFNTEQKKYCEITGEQINYNTSHVDHIIPFKTLVDNFIKTYYIDVDKVHYTFSIGVSFFLYDVNTKRIMDTWIDYHRENALLRVISANANLQRSRK